MKPTLSALLLLILLLSACTAGGPVQPSPTASLPPTGTAPTAAPTTAAATVPPSPTAAPTTAAPTLPAVSPAATSPVASPAAGQPAILVDHTSVDLFDQIPAEYLQAARALRMMYVDASVGWNISENLSCLSAASWASAPPYCRSDYLPGSWEVKTFTAGDLAAGSVPANIQFTPDPARYDRSQWTFVEQRGDWNGLVQAFIDTLAPEYLDKTDVLSFQFNYQHVAGQDRTSIADPQAGFFSPTSPRTNIADLEAFIAQHPDKTFFFWTTSLARSIGTTEAADFNTQMRNYAARSRLILFDVADIESHTPTGEPCYDNRDGVEYCDMHGNCENFADDGLDLPAICQVYTSEPEGGHLGSTAAGGLRLAKAMWVLMAQIAGWTP